MCADCIYFIPAELECSNLSCMTMPDSVACSRFEPVE